MNKRGILIFILVMSLLVMGCSTSTNSVSNINTVEKLKNAKEITIQEELMSLNKHYDIYVDGQKVADVEGKLISMFGDSFTLTDAQGNTLAKENQIKRWGVKLTRGAVIKDGNNEIIGYIGEKVITNFTHIGYYFHFYDINKNEIGHSKEAVFTLLDKYNYYDNNGNEVYQVNKNLTFLHDEYTISVKDNSKVSVYNAILMACIEDAIKDAVKDTEDKKKK